MIYDFPLLFSHSKSIWLSTLITIIITYCLLIINYYYNNYKIHNNYCSVGVMELCLLNLLILNDWFLCNSYHCVLFKTLSHVINQESHVSSWNLGKIYLVHFLKFWNLPRFTREILQSYSKLCTLESNLGYLFRGWFCGSGGGGSQSYLFSKIWQSYRNDLKLNRLKGCHKNFQNIMWMAV